MSLVTMERMVRRLLSEEDFRTALRQDARRTLAREGARANEREAFVQLIAKLDGPSGEAVLAPRRENMVWL